MRKAIFYRKAVDIQELGSGKNTIKEEFIVERKVCLSKKAFDAFTDNFFQDQDFIKDNIEAMRQDENDVFHCILVYTEGRGEGVLVESEGYSYARYAALVDIRKARLLDGNA